MSRRAVLDTSVLVAALRSSRGASYALLIALQQQRFVAVATPALFLEYEEVLKRRDQKLAHMLPAEDIDGLLFALTRHVEQVRIYYRWRPQLQDAGDEMILEAALNGRADSIVTHNLRHFRSVEGRFGLQVLSPSEFVKEVNT